MFLLLLLLQFLHFSFVVFIVTAYHTIAVVQAESYKLDVSVRKFLFCALSVHSLCTSVLIPSPLRGKISVNHFFCQRWCWISLHRTYATSNTDGS